MHTDCLVGDKGLMTPPLHLHGVALN